MSNVSDKQKDLKDSNPIGRGIGVLAADLIPFMPSGARRAGAAQIMGQRLEEGERPNKATDLLLRNPDSAQLLALGLGSALMMKDRQSPEFQQRQTAGHLTRLLGPLAVTQLLKSYLVRDIDSKYQRTRRKRRLREVDDDTDDPQFLGASRRLGASQAVDAMRGRRYRDLGALSEGADALNFSANSVLPVFGGAMMLPVTQGIDSRELRLRKEASDQEEDDTEQSKKLTDQRRTPVIPAMVLSGLGANAVLHLAGKSMIKQLRDDRATTMPDRQEKREFIKHISEADPELIHTSLVGDNAFFGRPRNQSQTEGMAGFIYNYDEHPDRKRSGIKNLLRVMRSKEDGYVNRLVDGAVDTDRLRRYGLIGSAPSTRNAPIIAHEAGHAKIEQTPGLVRWLQRHPYHMSGLIAPLAAGGSAAAGLASGGTLKGALAGTLIGGLATAGQTVPEYMATHHALKGLKSYDGGKLADGDDRKLLMKALATYLSANILPSTLAGAAGGYLSTKRKKRKDDDKDRSDKDDSSVMVDR